MQKLQTPQDDIFTAFKLELDPSNIVDSMRDLDRAYAKSGFNSESKLGLIRRKLKKIPDVFQIVLVRSVQT